MTGGPRGSEVGKKEEEGEKERKLEREKQRHSEFKLMWLADIVSIIALLAPLYNIKPANDNVNFH